MSRLLHLSQEERAAAVRDLQRRYGNRQVQRMLARLVQPEPSETDEPDQVGADVTGRIAAQQGSGQPLDAGARAEMETTFGQDFSGVRVHTDTEADSLNREVQARAFTTGRDIFFRQGNYSPGSSAGKELLAHELTHVVQQSNAPAASGGPARVTSPDDATEVEAGRVAEAVVSRQPVDEPLDEEEEAVALARQAEVLELDEEEEGMALAREAGVPELEEEEEGLALAREEEGAEETEATEGAPSPSWNIDPNKLLDDPGVNLEFKNAAVAGLRAAAESGLRPKVHEAYRTAERSDELYKKWKAGKGGRAAPGWRSVHNYGLAMDVYLYDEKGKFISNKTHKGWYRHYKNLDTHMSPQNLVWGDPINDAVHFEYHPNWSGLANGELLERNRQWAMEMAEMADNAAQANVSNWLEYFWWAAGAGGQAPTMASKSGEDSQPEEEGMALARQADIPEREEEDEEGVALAREADRETQTEEASPPVATTDIEPGTLPNEAKTVAELADDIWNTEYAVLGGWETATKLFQTVMTSASDKSVNPDFGGVVADYFADLALGAIVSRSKVLEEGLGLLEELEKELGRARKARDSANLRSFVVDFTLSLGKMKMWMRTNKTEYVGSVVRAHQGMAETDAEAYRNRLVQHLNRLDSTLKSPEELFKLLSERWINVSKTWPHRRVEKPAFILIRVDKDWTVRNAEIKAPGGQKIAEQLLKFVGSRGVDVYSMEVPRRVLYFEDSRQYFRAMVNVNASGRWEQIGSFLEGGAKARWLYEQLQRVGLPPTTNLSGD